MVVVVVAAVGVAAAGTPSGGKRNRMMDMFCYGTEAAMKVSVSEALTFSDQC